MAEEPEKSLDGGESENHAMDLSNPEISQSTNHDPKNCGKVDENPFGPWMLVKKSVRHKSATARNPGRNQKYNNQNPHGKETKRSRSFRISI